MSVNFLKIPLKTFGVSISNPPKKLIFFEKNERMLLVKNNFAPMKKIAILGSTGNVGNQVLDVIRKNPNKLKIVALTVNKNTDLLRKQIKEFSPHYVGVINEESAKNLENISGVKIFSGPNANVEIVKSADYDILVNSVVGLDGIEATVSAIKMKKDIALANKETLVAAGEVIMNLAKKNKVRILPIDSEHSALFQCLKGEKLKDVHRLIITCSGGALRDKNKEEIRKASVKEALGHKTWSMGDKITIDSATLMNKGFEVIEAMWLYSMPIEKIKVVIHPESLIHSMIEYSDGSIIAQISEPDMRLPIQYALSHPERWDTPIKRFDFKKNLTFSEPDLERFPCLDLAFQAARELGTLPAVMNAANDFMVAKFLEKKCTLGNIHDVVSKVMSAHKNMPRPKLKDINKAIAWSKNKAEKIFKKNYEH